MRKFMAMAGALIALMFGIPDAGAEEANATVEGGSLSTTASNVSFGNATLNGDNQTVSADAASQWSTEDARGTGAAWTVSIKSTDLTSAAGTTETTARTIGVAQLSVTTGTVTAGTGSDPATGLTAASGMTLATTDQTLLSSPGSHKGTYAYTPSFSLVVPANAFRSNYSGTVGSSALNPYTGTITITTA